MTAHRLDVPELYARLDQARESAGLSWRALGRQLGVCSSTFSRMSRGMAPDAHTLVTLLAWLDLDSRRVTQLREDVRTGK